MRPYLSLISSQDRLSISLQINDFRWITFLNELWKTFRWYLSYGIKPRFKSFLFYSKSHFAVAKWIWTSDISRIFASFRFHKREWSSKYHTYCHNEKSVHLPQFQSDSKSGITLAPFNEPPPLTLHADVTGRGPQITSQWWLMPPGQLLPLIKLARWLPRYRLPIRNKTKLHPFASTSSLRFVLSPLPSLGVYYGVFLASWTGLP